MKKVLTENDEVFEPFDSIVHRWMTGFLRVLTAGAGLVILIGGIMLLTQRGSAYANFGTFQGVPCTLKTPSQIVVRGFHGDPLSIVQTGILLLIAAPVLRVLFVGIGYWIEKDWVYVVVALIVLAVLIFSLSGYKV